MASFLSLKSVLKSITFVVDGIAVLTKKSFEFPCPKHKNNTSIFELILLEKINSVSPTKS